MHKGSIMVLVALLIFAVIVGAFIWENRTAPWVAPYLSEVANNGQQKVGQASYSCDMGKTIAATYYSGLVATTSPGQVPIPNGSVALVLSDGRALTLPQTLSGSGIRYANQGELIVFWSKGNTAFMTEGATTTYVNCISVSSIAGQENWNIFVSSTPNFSLRYPPGYLATTTYTYQELGPGKDISGVKFTIPPAMRNNTNLGSDSYVSVEYIPNQPGGECTAVQFLDLGNRTNVQTVTDNGITYSFASTTGAGAGNRYEEWVWAIPGTNPCIAVRYFIHYSVLQNYPPGTVVQFNEQALLQEFDGVRRSLVLGQ